MTSPEAVTAIVLAGGRSTRMGRDKASLVLGGRTLLQRVVDAVGVIASEVVVVGAPGRDLPAVVSPRALLLVADSVEGQGPLAGIIAGLDATERAVAVVVGCDQPFVQPALLAHLAELATMHVAAVPVVDGRAQPLCSAVRREALPALRTAFEGGQRAARVIADLDGAVLVPPDAWQAFDPDGRSFAGVNTPQELDAASRYLRAISGPQAT